MLQLKLDGLNYIMHADVDTMPRTVDEMDDEIKIRKTSSDVSDIVCVLMATK